MQQAIFTPVALTVLDVTTKGEVSMKRILSQPLHQPLLIGSLGGIIVSAINRFVHPQPLEEIGIGLLVETLGFHTLERLTVRKWGVQR